MKGMKQIDAGVLNAATPRRSRCGISSPLVPPKETDVPPKKRVGDFIVIVVSK
jgi:hypothetical protein